MCYNDMHGYEVETHLGRCIGKMQWLMREDIPVSARLRAGFMVNTDLEYMAGLRYILTRHTGFWAHYDSDMGFGAGLLLSY